MNPFTIGTTTNAHIFFSSWLKTFIQLNFSASAWVSYKTQHDETCSLIFICSFQSIIDFFTFQEECIKSIKIMFVNSATVSDVIGLALYKYAQKVSYSWVQDKE